MKKSIKLQTTMTQNMKIVEDLYDISEKNSDGSLQGTILRLDMIAISLSIFTDELKYLGRKKGYYTSG